MSPVRLQRVDDALRDYWVLHGSTCIGEVRARAFGTSELHMADARYLLRRDDTAEALVKRGGWLRAIAGMAALRGRYSLRDGERVVAVAERRFRWSTRRDGLHLAVHGPAGGSWSIRKRDGLRGPWRIDAGEAVQGHVESRHSGREFAWYGPALPAAVVAFALYALHQQFGAQPDAGGDGGGE